MSERPMQNPEWTEDEPWETHVTPRRRHSLLDRNHAPPPRHKPPAITPGGYAEDAAE